MWELVCSKRKEGCLCRLSGGGGERHSAMEIEIGGGEAVRRAQERSNGGRYSSLQTQAELMAILRRAPAAVNGVLFLLSLFLETQKWLFCSSFNAQRDGPGGSRDRPSPKTTPLPCR